MLFWKSIMATLAAVLALWSAGTALAGTLAPLRDEPQLAACIRQAAQGKKWLEMTLWGLRDQEAGWIGAEVANTNGTHDLGILQVNSGWVPHLAALLDQRPDAVRAWLRDDPCFNAQAGRWIFLSGLRQAGDYWKAIGLYHSPNAWRQQMYANRVAGHLRRRFGEAIFSATGPQLTAVRAVPMGR